jgi:metallo-beta-lactamase class B
MKPLTLEYMLERDSPEGRAQRVAEMPFPAYKVIGNIYYVGEDTHASLLITTPQGHILINSNYEKNVPWIRESVEKLGFKFNDIKILLGSHAHADHMEGDALVKQLTGAQVMAMDRDIPALQKMMPGGKPHPIDRVLHDGDTVVLGDTTLKAVLTPGHTEGCTTWVTKTPEGGKTYDVVFMGCIGANGRVTLVDNKAYPKIADDFKLTFKTLRGIHADVFMGSHTEHYNMKEKYAALGKGSNPFVDPGGYFNAIDNYEKMFNYKLEQQTKK